MLEPPANRETNYPLQTPGFSASPTPDDPPWTSPAALGVWVFSVLAIILLPNLFVLPYVKSQNISFDDSARLIEFLQSDATAILLNLLAIIPAHIFTILVAWIVVTRFARFRFFEVLGWKWGGMKWWHIPAIIAGFFAIAAVAGHYIPEKENDILRIIRSSRAAVYVLAFLATFTAPFVEEVVYRGILYSAFQRTLGAVMAVIAVTLLFAVVHVPQYYPSYVTIGLLTLLSLILTMVRVKTRNLLPCVVIHFLFNGIQSLTLILEPYLQQTPAELPDATTFITRLIT